MTTARRPVIWLARTVGASLWIGALIVVAAGAAEIWLRVQGDRESPVENGDPYGPFRVQHLHPQYQFFFPFEPEARIQLSNDVVHLTAEGFRGPGPAEAGDRRLAFLLGGSATFGDFASSDSTTITGYLNQLQDEYFFVNAGVPSWVSTQEMFRLAFELVKYAPALVVAYNGFNDGAVILEHAARGGGLSTVGAHESFLRLSAVIDDLKAGPTVPRYHFLPELRELFGLGNGDETWTDPLQVPIPEEVLAATVSQYLNNMDRMHDMTTAAGGRFAVVFQPIAGLHQRVPREFASWTRENDTLARFHRAVLAERSANLEFHDLAAVFDGYFDAVPVALEDGPHDEPIFRDVVHLSDWGNRLVAQRLVELLFSERT